MKKILLIALAISLVSAGAAIAGVTSSAHDLSSQLSSSTQICVFCHHPHVGANATQDDLLWNINDSTANYPTYDGTDTTISEISGANLTAPQSLLCMGCHDGSGGSNTYANRTVDNLTNELPNNLAGVTSLLSGAANLGETLADDHPMGFVYDSTLPESGDLQAVTTIAASPSGYGVQGTGSSVYPIYGGGDGVGTMECATCHDVHAGGTTSADANIEFMRGNMAASEMCIDCHTAK